MLMEPKIRPEEMVELVKDAVGRFPAGTALYIKPMFWADSGWIYPDPASTRFLLNVFERPLPDGNGFSAHVSPRRRPAPGQAPNDPQAAALHAHSGHAPTGATDVRRAARRDKGGPVG